ncbi:MAG: adenylate kinase [Anaerolineales bacterium]|nr:adenylate kinase [Anaerolineales bacterium]
MKRYVVLIGAPGAGKGTQARALSAALGLAHVSSGDLFREHLKNQTDLGKLADTYIRRGHLVPDEVTVGMVKARLQEPDCGAGAVLDGFPRTPAQAAALDKLATGLEGEVAAVVLLNVQPDILIERLCGRWVCRAGGHIYHQVATPPKTPGRCDLDGSELYQRDDDRRETVNERLRVYLEQTQVLVDYYRKRGLLLEVDGSPKPEVVTARLLTVVEDKVKA